MQQLSETSLTMKTALEGGGEGFDALGEKAAAARGEVQRTEQAIRRLNAADALQNLRDTDHAYTPYPMNRGSSAGKTHMRRSSWSCWNR